MFYHKTARQQMIMALYSMNYHEHPLQTCKNFLQK